MNFKKTYYLNFKLIIGVIKAFTSYIYALSSSSMPCFFYDLVKYFDLREFFNCFIFMCKLKNKALMSSFFP